ncbi:hypothetical protein GVN24_28700 [Rhizobium sp. CRIBSB]|nr:hypothetical protein [Rhizobium sp. CRIBSB]
MDDMPTGLVRRGGRYSLRRRVPLDLVAHYGRKEITSALGTSDPKEARVLLTKAWAALDETFARLRQSGAATTPSSGPVPPAAPKSKALPYVPTSEEVEYDIESARHSFEISFQQDCEYEAREEERQRLLLTLDVPDEFLSAEQRAMKDLLSDAKLDVETAEMKARTLEIAGAKPPPSKPVLQKSEPHKANGTPFAVLVDKWAKERGREGKAARDHLAVTRWLTERTGVETVEALTKQHVLTFKDTLLADGTTPANVNVKLSRLRTLLNFASDNAMVHESAALKVRVLDPESARNRRKSFDMETLAKLFGGPVHAAGERPAGGRGEAAYWLPLLALYTGARREELGQLRPKDVREETYIGPDDDKRTAWVIAIVHDEEAGLRLKNAGSERTIPVHADLLTLGFARFVRKAQDAKQARLFPDLRPNRDGRVTEKWGEWFSIYRRDVCDIEDPRLVFHSFRHTFKDCARNSAVPDPIQRQLMGHSSGDVADGYGVGYGMHQLVEGMKLYRVPGFKLPPPPE